MTSRYKKPMELYVHIPFCARKCFYCDFLSFRAPEPVHEAYSAQLIREIEAQGAFCREYQVTSIFIGGGTPSVMEPCLIADIMRALKYHFDVATDAEITIEVNPGTLLHNKLHIYREAGINRLSIGLQSTDNQELRDLGRIHTFEEFLKSYQCARMVGFPDINVDLMSSIPGQTLESFKNTLKKVTMLKPEHISAYSLIIEEGTPFWDRYGQGKAATVSFPPLPDEDTENRIYHLTRTFLGNRDTDVTKSPTMQSLAMSAGITSATGQRYPIWDWDWAHPPIWAGAGSAIPVTWICTWAWILPGHRRNPLNSFTAPSRNCPGKQGWRNSCFWDCALPKGYLRLILLPCSASSWRPCSVLS